MNEQPYRVVTCGLCTREERVLDIVLARVVSTRFRYVSASHSDPCDIVIVDPQNPLAAAQLRQLRERNPCIAALSLMDGLPAPGARHLLSRRTLWSHLITTLDDVVQHDLLPRAHLRETSAIVGPVAALPKAGESAAVPAAANHAEARIHALIVDDSATVRTQIEAALRKLGISSDSADDWSAAERLLDSGSYDVMFLDVVMPAVDGYEACRRVRRRPTTRRLPVLMLTSRSSAFDRARGALAGCDMYLVKPIDLAAFHTAVNKIVARICQNDLRKARQRGFTPAAAWPG